VSLCACTLPNRVEPPTHSRQCTGILPRSICAN